MNFDPINRVRRRFSAAFAIGMAALIVAPTACAETPVTKLERIDAFQVAYAMSFRLDACGDTEIAGLLRRAVLEKFDRCPFTDDAKSRFKGWTSTESNRQQTLLQQYLAQHGKLPDRLDGMKETCAEYRGSSENKKTHELRKHPVKAVPGSVSAAALLELFP